MATRLSVSYPLRRVYELYGLTIGGCLPMLNLYTLTSLCWLLGAQKNLGGNK